MCVYVCIHSLPHFQRVSGLTKMGYVGGYIKVYKIRRDAKKERKFKKRRGTDNFLKVFIEDFPKILFITNCKK